MVIKIVGIVFSSFEQVLYLDLDNQPVVDPAIMFDARPYKEAGALFWPDVCTYHTATYDAYRVFGLPVPPNWPVIELDPVTKSVFPSDCDPTLPFEIQGGDMVIHKKRTWRALMMHLFISKAHQFFQTILYGEKQRYSFAFNVTGLWHQYNR